MSDIHQFSDQEIHDLISLEAEKYDGWMVCGCKCASGKAGECIGIIPMCCVVLNALECDCGKDDAYVYRVYSVYGQTSETESGTPYIEAINSISSAD